MQPLLIDGIRTELEHSIVNSVDVLPTLLAAIAIVYIGLFVGSKLQPSVGRVGRRIELDEKVRQTPFGALFPDGQQAVSHAFAVLAKYYVALIAVFVAAEWLSLQFVTNWIEGALSYVPSLAAGAVILVVGFFLADHVADSVRRSESVRESGFSAALAGFSKVFLYFVVAVIGLDTMGVNVTILYTFAEAFAYAAGLAAALAVGIAFGWGGKDYVAENLDDWFEDSTDVASDSKPVADD